MLSAIRLTISLLKLRAGFAIAATAIAGIAATNGPAPSWASIAGMGLAVLGASCATGAFNHYYERDVDRLMRRTQGRPFASGAFKPAWWWPAGFIILLTVSLALAATAGGHIAAGYVFLGAFAYAVVYTVWLKRRWAWSIVGGGLAGSCVVLAGAAAVDPTPQVLPTVLAAAVYLWAPAHFWSLAAVRSDDYRSAGIPMLPLVTPAPTWTLYCWYPSPLATGSLTAWEPSRAAAICCGEPGFCTAQPQSPMGLRPLLPRSLSLVSCFLGSCSAGRLRGGPDGVRFVAAPRDTFG